MRLSKSFVLSVSLVAILSVAVAARSIGPKTELRRRNSRVVETETASKDPALYNEEDDDDDGFIDTDDIKLAAALPTTLKARDIRPRNAIIFDENNFCIFFPPDDHTGTLAQRWDATESCCTGPRTLDWSPCRIPDGLIQPNSVRFVRSVEKYVEISGRLNVTMLHTNGTDTGVGYSESTLDGSACGPYYKHVAFLEPSENGHFLLRCCDKAEYCPDDTNVLNSGAQSFLKTLLENKYPNL
ncbi:hypothetical protein BGZ72_008317 [Mortierella alpina]|nr:hypothetical protein BGZ72_008317 [Mortierella alpina]